MKYIFDVLLPSGFASEQSIERGGHLEFLAFEMD